MREQTIQVRSRVTVRHADGEEETYTIVPAMEANPRSGLISSESPLGRVLLGRRAGEQVIVNAPGRSYTVMILAISESN